VTIYTSRGADRQQLPQTQTTVAPPAGGGGNTKPSKPGGKPTKPPGRG
jgi:hypothetical protein